ncbi:hypothetical protein [Phytoactinopolyspora limicola]|uniref:hypothetical protein n=1 Tax=Phytoactinopolyspora limicola TaxID=2715536 RepID=UPI00140DE317|nr:hypothetical protein [Phytoactinopolyspora limicola]
MASEETIREAARVLADSEAAERGALPYSDISWAGACHRWLPRARALDAAGLLPQEMTEEWATKGRYTLVPQPDEETARYLAAEINADPHPDVTGVVVVRRLVTEWEEVPDA